MSPPATDGSVLGFGEALLKFTLPPTHRLEDMTSLNADCAGAELNVAAAVRDVGRGLTVFAPRPKQPSAPLSEHEREVLALMASGKTNREIADRLFLSLHTVKEHTSAVYRKLHVRNRNEAVQRAERLGLTV